jgi:hypothetical protein
MMREEPSLETLWLKNKRTMDKVQITYPSPTNYNLNNVVTKSRKVYMQKHTK